MGSHFLLNEIGLLILHKDPVSRLEHLGSARVWLTGPLEEITGGRTLHRGEEHVLSSQRSIHSSQAADGGHTTTWLLRSQCKGSQCTACFKHISTLNTCVSICIFMCAYQVVSVYVLIDESMLEVHVCIGFDPPTPTSGPQH